MDGARFDALTKGLAASTSRRGVLKGAIGGLLAALAGTSAAAASCRGATDICRKDGDCCSKRCGPADATGRRRCICPPGQEACNRTCVDPAVAYQSDPKNCGGCGIRCPLSSDPCLMAVCTQGVCGFGSDPAKVGRPCNDGDNCTENDVCRADGSCAGTPKSCSTDDPCQVAFCDPITGECAGAPAADGSACNADNSACTVDTCQQGVCVAGPPKDCSTDPAVNDQCNTGVCDPGSGQCVKQPKENGLACNADDSLCTENDTCQAGVCTPGTAKTCPASLNQCQINGSCDPATGECVYQFAPATTPCDDGNPFCFDGFCCASSCTVYSNPLDENTGQTICCPSGQTCQSFDLSGASGPANAGICCTSGTEACFEVTSVNLTPNLICCPSGTGCRPLGFGSIQPLPVGACCAGDACLLFTGFGTSSPIPIDIVCCETGESCTSVDLSALSGGNQIPVDVGACCETGTESCLEISLSGNTPSVTSVCCAAGETCQSSSVSGFPASVCCATEACPVVSFSGSTPTVGLECCSGGTVCSTATPEGAPFEIGLCCPEGQEVTFSLSGGSPTIACTEPCATELCTVIDLATQSVEQVCCPSGTGCRTIEGLPFSIPGAENGVGQCCAEGVPACVTGIVNSTPTFGCCEGTCHPISAGFEFCCPAGSSPVFSGQTITCMSETACPVFTNGVPAPIDCPEGTECLSTTFNGVEIGACCTADNVLAIDEATTSSICCPAARVCVPSGFPLGYCCAEDEICSSGSCQSPG